MAPIILPQHVSFPNAIAIAVGSALVSGLREVMLLNLNELFLQVTHAIYKRYEPKPGQFLATFFLLGIMPSISVPFVATHFSSFIAAIAVSFSIFYSTLISSIVLYRISPFHPLYKYPGPFLAKISKFWNVWVMASGKNHVCYKNLHAKYGPYVRIGMPRVTTHEVVNLLMICFRSQRIISDRCWSNLLYSRRERNAEGPKCVDLSLRSSSTLLI